MSFDRRELLCKLFQESEHFSWLLKLDHPSTQGSFNWESFIGSKNNNPLYSYSICSFRRDSSRPFSHLIFLGTSCDRKSRYCYLQMRDEGPVAQVPVNPVQGFTTTKWPRPEPLRFDAGPALLLIIWERSCWFWKRNLKVSWEGGVLASWTP